VDGRRWLAAASVAVASTLTARGAEAELEIDQDLARNEPAYLSTSFLDPLNRTRAHATVRFGFFEQELLLRVPNAEPQAARRDTMLGSAEITFVLRGTDHFSVAVTLPIGWEVTDGFDAIALYGNTKLGFNFGGEVQLPGLQASQSTRPIPKIGLAGALEIYAPTALDVAVQDCGARVFCSPMENLRQFRSLEPELWTNDAVWFRTRWHTDFRIDIVQFDLELGLTPGVTIQDQADFVLLANWATRAAVLPVPEVELFAELGASYGVVTPDDRVFPSAPGVSDFIGDVRTVDDDLDTPVRLILGTRLHLASASFDPAIFVSFDFDQANVMFGLDLAGMIRSRPGERMRRETDPLDF
jgi:hypothetical protein